MKKILIADDHYILRKGLKQILTDEYGQIEMGEAENGMEAFKMAKDKKWDIMILDINMPGPNGLEVLKQLRLEKVEIPVLVLSMHPEEQVALEVLKLGAKGYITKGAVDTELIKAINKILNNKKYISLAIAVQLIDRLDPDDKKDIDITPKI